MSLMSFWMSILAIESDHAMRAHASDRNVIKIRSLYNNAKGGVSNS